MPKTNMDDAKCAEKTVSEALLKIYVRFACAAILITSIKFALFPCKMVRGRRQRMVLQSTGLPQIYWYETCVAAFHLEVDAQELDPVETTPRVR